MHGISGGDCSIAAENIYLCKRRCWPVFPTKVQTQPALSTYSYTSVTLSHLDPTRKKQRVSTSGTDSPIISEHECYTWNRLVSGSECLHLEPTHLKYRFPNHQEASVKHLDPTCRRTDTLTTNWIITEPTQKNSEF